MACGTAWQRSRNSVKVVTNSAQPNLETLLHIAKVLEVNLNDLVRPLE